MIVLCEKKRIIELGIELEQLVENWLPGTNTYFSVVIHQYSKESKLRLSTDFMGQKCVGTPQGKPCLACHLLWIVSVKSNYGICYENR